MEDSWITVILASVFIVSTSESNATDDDVDKKPFWIYLIITFLYPPIAVLIFLYLLVNRKEKPKYFGLLFLYSALSSFFILFYLQ